MLLPLSSETGMYKTIYSRPLWHLGLLIVLLISSKGIGESNVLCRITTIILYRLVGRGGAGWCMCTPGFEVQVRLKFMKTTVCKVVSLRQSPTEYKVVGHPLA